jgi:hypoxanthine-DNA glycosylase
MIETHPFGNFVPPNVKYLILGSFTGRQAVKGTSVTDDSYDWFYGTRKNQFWPILEEVYGIKLRAKRSKQELLTQLGIAMADIIYQCERKDDSNLDSNLSIIEYNTKAIAGILDGHQIEKIYFTSRFVEERFKKEFKDIIYRHPGIELITLPSPSPRYARMSKEQKINKYKDLLPEIVVPGKTPPVDKMGTLAQKLERLFKEVRKPDGSKYTQTEVVEGTQGMLTRVYLWKLRTGRATNPSFKVVQALADFFGVDSNYFSENEAAADSEISRFAGRYVDEIRDRAIKLDERGRKAILALMDYLLSLQNRRESR